MNDHQKKRLVNVLSVLAFLALVGIGMLKEYWLKPQPVMGQVLPDSQVTKVTTAATDSPVIANHPSAAVLTVKINRLDQSAEDDLQALRQVIDLYHRAHGENPEGDNADVVQALLGRNQHHTAFLLADAPFIRDGLMRDRWGSPYFVHPEDAHTMSLRSAGPDLLLFSEDDITTD